MGIYIYLSKHADYCKIGHYKGNNAWSRVAHRGFYSTKCPKEIENSVSIKDLKLKGWFPNLKKEYEKKVKNKFGEYIVCGEWYNSKILLRICKYLSKYDKNVFEKCNKEDSIKTLRRL